MTSEIPLGPQTPIPVTIHRVPDEDEDDCLRRHFGQRGPLVRQTVLGLMSRLSRTYRGRWAAFELSNGGLYMAPIESSLIKVRLREFNFQRHLTVQAAGILASVLAFEMLCGSSDADEQLRCHWQWLKDFARSHAECRSFAAALG